MSKFRISDMSLGEIDSKNEILKQRKSGSSVFYDSFYTPLGFREEYITSGSRYFICGQKGVGKTALLRWFKRKLEKDSQVLMILFKTDVREEDRHLLSSSTGYELAKSLDKGEYVFQQDFKYAWSLYIHRMIATQIREHYKEKAPNPDVLSYIDFFEKNKKTIWSRVGSIFPSFSNGKLKLSLDIPLISSNSIELGVENQKGGTKREEDLAEVVNALGSGLN